MLKKVKTVKEMGQEKGFTSQQNDESVDVPEDKVITYKVGTADAVEDGDG